MSTGAVTCTVCVLHTETTFHVEGMDCHEEVALLDRKLRPLRGLETMRADVVAQRLHVAHDAAVLPASAIAAAVAETGMRAWPARETSPQASTPPRTSGLVPLAVSAAALAIAATTTYVWPSSVASAAALVVAIGVGGAGTARRAWRALRMGVLDMNVLMTIAVVGAVVLGDFVEAASVVFLFAVSQVLESRSMERVRRSVRALMDLAPKQATVRRHGHEASMAVADLAVGDLVVVRPGERVPADGEVEAGDGEVNQAPVTGESLPVRRTVGDAVFAGSVNGEAVLDVRVTRVGNDSTLARIIHLVEHAQGQRAQSQAFVERFARIYTPAVIGVAALLAVVPPLVFDEPWLAWFYRALVMLVIACPCALVISTPVAIVSALTAAARQGVLVKGGVHLERLAGVSCVAFDKTGTLTEGRLAVEAVSPWNGLGPDEVVRVAASAERHSEHLIGRAIVHEAYTRGVALAESVAFTATTGSGVEARVDGRQVRVGSPRHFSNVPWWDERVEHTVASHRDRGWTTVLVEQGGALIGVLALGDRVRDEAAAVVAEIKARGISAVAMLTGDHPAAASYVAAATGVDVVHAELMPEQKMRAVSELCDRHGAVAMVGDGVNDAPALALADVGIAMGAAGTDAALETADVALMGDDLRKLPFLMRLSRATLTTIRVNVAFALALKLAFLVLAAFGLSTLWMAIVADTGASLLVIANSLRLLALGSRQAGSP